MRYPPILISVIGFFAVMAGFAFLFLGLRMLGFDWFGLFGDLPQFESIGIWGWLATLAGIAWMAAGIGLWSLRPWAWAFAMIMAGISLFEAFLLLLQYPGSGLGLGAALLPGVILLYLNSRDVKAAFGLLPVEVID